MSTPLFDLGDIVATPGALGVIEAENVRELLTRHAGGDWGCVGAGDSATSDAAIVSGARLFSAYAIDPSKPCAGHGENCVWIITEADRSTTRLLLPDEY